MSEPLLPPSSPLPPLHDYIMDTDLSEVDGIFGYAGTAKNDDDKIVDVFVPINFEQALEMMGFWKKPRVN